MALTVPPFSDSEANHKCGIAGVSFFSQSKSSSEENAALALYKMLLQLQHRGQLSAGITVHKPESDFLLQTYKDLGSVNKVFSAENKETFQNRMNQYTSLKGIGHVRYATCGSDDVAYAQPFEHLHGKKDRWFSIAFNGNIANYEELKADLEKQNYHFIRKTDTELILLLLAKALKTNPDLIKALKKVSTLLDGAYNLAYIDAQGTLVAIRDPLGIRPLCYGTNKTGIAFASESVALQSIGFTEIKDLAPGHALIISNDSYRIEKFSEPSKKAHCFFEWVYFAHAASNIDGKLVYSVRRKLGEELGKRETLAVSPKEWVVVSVPDSSTPCGQGFSETLNIPLQEGLIRNRYVGRTFIESRDRNERVKSKFTLIQEVFEGKKVFLIEDSIVRGTTLKNLVEFIRTNGHPKEIHVRVSCPPIMWPCFYGIDMSSRKELIAANQSVSEIAKEIGADSLTYQSKEGLLSALGFKETDVCLACLTGIYPSPAGTKNAKNDSPRKMMC